MAGPITIRLSEAAEVKYSGQGGASHLAVSASNKARMAPGSHAVKAQHHRDAVKAHEFAKATTTKEHGPQSAFIKHHDERIAEHTKAAVHHEAEAAAGHKTPSQAFGKHEDVRSILIALHEANPDGVNQFSGAGALNRARASSLKAHALSRTASTPHEHEAAGVAHREAALVHYGVHGQDSVKAADHRAKAEHHEKEARAGGRPDHTTSSGSSKLAHEASRHAKKAGTQEAHAAAAKAHMHAASLQTLGGGHIRKDHLLKAAEHHAHAGNSSEAERMHHLASRPSGI